MQLATPRVTGSAVRRTHSTLNCAALGDESFRYHKVNHILQFYGASKRMLYLGVGVIVGRLAGRGNNCRLIDRFNDPISQICSSSQSSQPFLGYA